MNVSERQVSVAQAMADDSTAGSGTSKTTVDKEDLDELAQLYIRGKLSLADYKRALDAQIPPREVLMEALSKHEGFIRRLAKLLDRNKAKQ